MPSDLSTWLISAPQNGDTEGLIQEIGGKFAQAKALSESNFAAFEVPSLKVRIAGYTYGTYGIHLRSYRQGLWIFWLRSPKS